jgi:hypothetical protein
MKTLLIALLTSAAIPTSFAQQIFAQRWDDDVSQLMAVEAPIPYAELHAYALKILRDRIVAKDDAKER